MRVSHPPRAPGHQTLGAERSPRGTQLLSPWPGSITSTPAQVPSPPVLLGLPPPSPLQSPALAPSPPPLHQSLSAEPSPRETQPVSLHLPAPPCLCPHPQVHIQRLELALLCFTFLELVLPTSLAAITHVEHYQSVKVSGAPAARGSAEEGSRLHRL